MSVRLRSVVPMALCCLGLAHGGPAAAQTTLTLELGGSQVGPATDFDMADARFVIGGLRGTVNGANGSYVYGSFLGGNVLGDSTGGSFVSGLVAASVRDPWSERWIGSVDVKLLGFGVREPFPYRTVAAELEPAVRYQTASASLKVGLVGGVGHSSLELFFPRMGLGLDLENDLWRVGSSSELLVGSSTVQVGIAGSAHRTSADSYASVGGRLVLGGEWGVVELRGDRWSTPFGWETTGGLSLAIPFGGSMSVRGFVGRSDPDPLTLTQPGSGSGGALLGWTFLSTAPKLRDAEPLHEIVEYTEAGGRIRVSVEVPDGASSVRLLGDFTLWEAVEMRREGNRWIAELSVPIGTHHYGFMVDDEWYVPDDAPDVVPDEWGRRSATLVIEGAG